MVHGGLIAGPGADTWSLRWVAGFPAYFVTTPEDPLLPDVTGLLVRWRNPGNTSSGFGFYAFSADEPLPGFELEPTCLCRLNWVDADNNIVSLDSDTKTASQ